MLPTAFSSSCVPDEDTSTIGRCTSFLAVICTGLFVMSNPYGMLPPSSPTRRGSFRVAAITEASSVVFAGKTRLPMLTAVVATVVARITSTTTMAYLSR